MPKMLKKQSNESESEEEYVADQSCKRDRYKKISFQVKMKLIQEYFNQKLRISDISRRHSLSYSTINHILLKYEKDGKIFESKRSKLKRQAEKPGKTDTLTDKSQESDLPPVKIEPTQQFYIVYPCFYYSS